MTLQMYNTKPMLQTAGAGFERHGSPGKEDLMQTFVLLQVFHLYGTLNPWITPFSVRHKTILTFRLCVKRWL